MSSATWTLCQPSASVTWVVNAVQEKMYGTIPVRSQSWTKSLMVASADPGGPTGSPSATATPACLRKARKPSPSPVIMCRFSGQVVIQEMVLPPHFRSRSLATAGLEVEVASRRLLRRGTRNALRPRMSTTRNAR